MEAEDNTACGGNACLPELSLVSLNSSDNTTRYYGEPQVVQPQLGVAYTEIQSISIDSQDCASFQLSPDQSNYWFWNGVSWSIASTNAQSSSGQDIQDHIAQYVQQTGPGKLYIKAFLSTNQPQNSSCQINDIDLNYTND